jgi:hypothetical protein
MRNTIIQGQLNTNPKARGSNPAGRTWFRANESSDLTPAFFTFETFVGMLAQMFLSINFLNVLEKKVLGDMVLMV